MNREWHAFGTLVENFDHKRIPVATSKRKSGPYPYYGASGIVDYVDDYLFDGEYLLISEDGENLRTRSTPIAFIARGRFWVNNHAHVVRGLHGVADTRYLSYALAATDIGGSLSGSAQPKLSQASLHALELHVPPIADQQAIAEVLGALDDKITTNARIAETSDALVRSLYASLPPSESLLGGLCVNVREQVQPNGRIPYVGLEHVGRKHLWLHAQGTSDEVTSAKSAFETGDVLFGKLRPYFHKVVSAPVAGICSTDILVLRAKDPDMAGYVLAAAASTEVVDYSTARSAGTKMPRASWADLSEAPIRWADQEAALRLSETVAALRLATEATIRESRTLAHLRDTLLPALMDGRIRVGDAIAHAEALL